MDVELVWLTYKDLNDIHAHQLAWFGGLPGLKDEKLAHSAAAAPINIHPYEGEQHDLVLAIPLCGAIARNHAFNDGNKRTATAALIESLAFNGWDLLVPDDEADEPLLGQWVEKLISGTPGAVQLYDRLVHIVQERP